MGLFGILLGLGLLIWLAYRGWSILLLAPGAGLIAAAFAGGPLLAYWTQTFMDSASRFVAQFFPLFLLGALFGKLMEDSSSVAAIADFMTKRLGPQRVSLFVALHVLLLRHRRFLGAGLHLSQLSDFRGPAHSTQLAPFSAGARSPGPRLPPAAVPSRHHRVRPGFDRCRPRHLDVGRGG